jgi:hypothetical protein
MLKVEYKIAVERIKYLRVTAIEYKVYGQFGNACARVEQARYAKTLVEDIFAGSKIFSKEKFYKDCGDYSIKHLESLINDGDDLDQEKITRESNKLRCWAESR